MNTFAPAFALLCPAAALAAAIVSCERARRRAAEAESQSQSRAREATLRLLRLATGDQRSVALSLFGHAQSSQPENAALSGLARRLLDLSDDIVEQTERPDGPRYLQEEALVVGPVIEFAIAQVSAQLGPSRRVWRIAPSLAEQRLLADRRALNQVLVNVLCGAAAATRNGDWIEMLVRESPDGIAILIQDEGVGLPIAQGSRPEDSRGIGLRLTLARSLMQAHGGALTVVSAERVGTRVELGFPVARVLA